MTTSTVKHTPTPCEWIPWNGRDWDGDPDALVHVRFYDGATDEHLPPSPARGLGLAGEPSNWRWTRPNDLCVVAYRLADSQRERM